MKLTWNTALIAAALFTVACSEGGTDDDDDDDDDLEGAITATIDGQPFAAIVATMVYVPASGTLTILGTDQNRGISIGAAGLNSTGTYAIQLTTAPLINASTTFSPGSGSPLQNWTTGSPGGSGSITFTTLSATRVVGTFNFVAGASGTATTGTRTVTQGAFDISATASGLRN